MFQKQQLNQNPLSYAYGYGSRKNSNKPPSYLQINQISNLGNPTEQSVPAYLEDNLNNNRSFAPPFQNQLGTPLGVNMQAVVPFTSSGTVFYGDLQQQTCSDVKSFVKEDKEKHCCVLVFNIILFIFVIFGIALITTFQLPIWMIAQIIFVPYLLYFFLSLCSNALWQYFGNMKQYNYIQSVYQQLQQRTGHIQLKAQCYHFTRGKHRRRVVTHTAVHNIPVRQCIDVSQNLSQLKENNKFLFCKIKKYYYFGDQNSHNTFINTVTMFKANNIQDTHQQYYHSLDITIPDFSDVIGLSVNGTGGCLKPIYIIFLMLGLGYPYLMMIECWSQRYSLNIIKKLTI